MNIEGSTSGHNVVAGMHVSGGEVNMNFARPGPPRPVKPFSMIPFPPDPAFIKRPDISHWLEKTVVGVGRRAALVGLGGVGKSQMAIQHGHQVRNNAPSTSILWVHASSSARFKESYQDIAERLLLPGRNDPQHNVLQLVYRWLVDDNNGPWLMIIDNADDGDILRQFSDLSESKRPLVSFIPKTGQGSILVTSRSNRTAEMLVGEDSLCNVPVMEDEQAKALLRVRLGDNLYQDSAAASLIATLDSLPLAIVQAASFIKRRSHSAETITTYLQRFHKNKEAKTGLLNLEAPDLRRDESASTAVLSTWQMTFDQVRRERISATELLCFMSFLHSQDIPRFILVAFSNNGIDKELEDDIDILMGYSLIASTMEGKMLQMHPLVQFCTQIWLSTFDDQERWRCTYLKIMSSEYPLGAFENWTVCQKLEPHIQRAVEKQPTEHNDAQNWATLLYKAAWFRDTMGYSKQAEIMTRQALNARANLLGREHPDTLASMGILATVLTTQAKNREAETISRQAVEMMMKVLGKEHPQTLLSLDNLATVLRAQGKSEEGAIMHRQALETRTRILGKEHPGTLISLGNLAGVLQEQGKYEEGETMDRQVLEARIRVLGDEHPDTLASMSNLGLVLTRQGKHTEAIALQRQTLKAAIKVLGKEHPNTLLCMYNLASTLGAQGKNEEAETIGRHTLETRIRVLGIGHSSTLNSMNALALVLWVQGKEGEAEVLYRQVFTVRTNVFGKEHHPETLASMKNLAWVLRALGKNEEADAIY